MIKKRHGSIAALSVFMALIMLAGTFLLSAQASDDEQYEKIVLYHWKRVFKQDDLPDGNANVLFIWNDNGTDYCTSGSDTYSGWKFWFQGKKTSDYPGIDPDADEFYTETLCDCWTISFAANDPDNKDSSGKGIKSYLIKRSDGKYLSCDNGGNLSFAGQRVWGISTSNSKGCSYQKNTGYGKVQLYCNISLSRDFCVYYDEDCITTESNGSSDYPDFSMFVAYQEEFTTLKSYTVQNGSTFRVRDNVMLRSKDKITVEPGASFIISGGFICNGIIENYGNVTIEPEACITPSSVETDAKGSFISHGSSCTYTCKNGKKLTADGNLFISKNSCLSVSKNGEFTLADCSSCAVNGLLVAPDSIVLNDSEINVGKSGGVYFGYYLAPNMSVALTAAKSASGSPKGISAFKSGSMLIGEVSVVKGSGKYVCDASVRRQYNLKVAIGG